MRTDTAGWSRGARRLAALLATGVLVVIVALAISAGGSNGTYEVRAVFDDAGNIIPGENVKIDGVKVGVVGAVEPTPQAKAAVVLKIEDGKFHFYRSVPAS